MNKVAHVLILILLILVNNCFSQVPQINKIEPTSAKIGTQIKVTGKNFGSKTDSSKFYFGSVKSDLISVNDSVAYVNVPITSQCAQIQLSNKGLYTKSQVYFIPQYENNGTRQYNKVLDFNHMSAPAGLVLADFDNDGKLDLAVCNFGSNFISVYKNNSINGKVDNNTYGPQQNYTAGTKPFAIVAADFDNDGKIDLAVTNISSNTISIFKNTTNNGSISFSTKIDFVVGSSPFFLATGDIEKKKKIDIVL